MAAERFRLAAGIDVAILGPRESCTGDPARRAGNEYVWEARPTVVTALTLGLQPSTICLRQLSRRRPAAA